MTPINATTGRQLRVHRVLPTGHALCGAAPRQWSGHTHTRLTCPGCLKQIGPVVHIHKP